MGGKMKKTLIVIFIILLVFPSILWICVGEQIGDETTENRVLAEKPIFSLKNLEYYPENYENYYNDHVPFKSISVKLKSYLDYKLFHYIDSEKVLLGKNNWLFYKGEVPEKSPINDYIGGNHFTEKKNKKLSKKLTAVSQFLKEKNIDFSLMICPNKEHIYGGYLPENVKQINDICRADLFVEYVREHTSVPVIYPVEEIKKERNNYQLYYKYDTHWNGLGGFIGSQAIKKQYQNASDVIADYSVISTGDAVTDLALMINLQEEFLDDSNIVVEGYKPSVDSVLIEATEDGTVKNFHSEAEDKRTVMILRDSYGEAMMQYLSKDFENVIFVHRDVFSVDYIEKYHPDIVIYQTVERELNGLSNLKNLFGI